MVDDAPQGMKNIDSLIVATADMFRAGFNDKELSRDYSIALDLLVQDKSTDKEVKKSREAQAAECLEILRNIGK